MSTPADEFRLREFESLRKEIEFHLSSMGRSDDYCLLAVGAVCAWLFTSQLATTAAALLPGTIALLFYFKRICVAELVLKRYFHVYLMEKVEDGHFKIKGWEHFIHAKRFLMRWWYHVYYLGIIIGSLAVAGVVHNWLGSGPSRSTLQVGAKPRAELADAPERAIRAKTGGEIRDHWRTTLKVLVIERRHFRAMILKPALTRSRRGLWRISHQHVSAVLFVHRRDAEAVVITRCSSRVAHQRAAGHSTNRPFFTPGGA